MTRPAAARGILATPLGTRAAALGILAAAILTGCSSMSEKQCRTVNWTERGERDAYDGAARERVADYQDACAEHGIQADMAAYSAGYDKGLQRYCTAERGYAVGKAGGSYRRTCPPAQEAAFLRGFEVGKTIARETREANDLERKVKGAEEELKTAQSAEDRDKLRRKIRDLDEQYGDSQRRLRRLQDEATAAGYR